VDIQALFDYRVPVSQWITRLKFQGDLAFAYLMGDLMAMHLRLPSEKPDCIIPLPLHPARQRQRGFNQTLEMAKRVKKKSQIPIDATSCKKIRHTPAQSAMNVTLRRHNIHPDFFSVSSSLKGKKVLIIEDVVTTGRTLQAFCIALKNAGVVCIDVWTCCRTEKKREKRRSAVFI
jgi:ComF family protein